MNRRTFLKASSIAAGAATIPAATLMEGCSTTWIQTLNNDMPTIISIANSVLQVVAISTGNGAIAAAAAPEVNLITKAIQTGLTTLQQMVNDYNANPNADLMSKIYTALNDLLANLSALLPASGIKNVQLQTTITSVVAIVVTILQSIKLLLPPSAAPASMKAGHTAAQQKVAAVKATLKPSDAKALADAILADQ